MFKLLLLLAIFSLFNIKVYSQKVMIDKNELKSLLDFYFNSDTNNWYSNELKILKLNNIYSSISSIVNRSSHIKLIYDRDTLLNNEVVQILKFKEIDLGTMNAGNETDLLGKVENIDFISGEFEKLEVLRLRGMYNIKNAEYFKADSLRVLEIKKSNFKDKFNFDNFRNLEIFLCEDVESGIDLSFINLPKCKQFSIKNCKINSIVNIFNLNNVETFELIGSEGNRLTLLNTNSNELNKLKNIININISFTDLKWEIEDLIFPKADTIIFNNNFLEGKFPYLFTESAKYIDFSHNKFTQIRNEISLDNIEYLNLSHNEINSQIPKLNMNKLTYLDLSFNKINGNIDSALIRNKEYINLSYNSLSGELNFNFESNSLIYVNFSNNNLTGKIPKIKSNSLYRLDLSNNNFTNLNKDIEVNSETILDFSFNKLSFIDVVKRCAEYLENHENEYITSPYHIVSYSLHKEYDSKYIKYSDEQIFYEKLDNLLKQKKYHTSVYDAYTRMLYAEEIDTSLFYYMIWDTDPYKPNFPFLIPTDIYAAIPKKYWIYNYEFYAVSKFCTGLEFTYMKPKLINLDVKNKETNSCENLIAIEYFDLLGVKIDNSNIYNKQIIVRYKCLETGEISHKLEIRER